MSPTKSTSPPQLPPVRLRCPSHNCHHNHCCHHVATQPLLPNHHSQQPIQINQPILHPTNHPINRSNPNRSIISINPHQPQSDSPLSRCRPPQLQFCPFVVATVAAAVVTSHIIQSIIHQTIQSIDSIKSKQINHQYKPPSASIRFTAQSLSAAAAAVLPRRRHRRRCSRHQPKSTFFSQNQPQRTSISPNVDDPGVALLRLARAFGLYVRLPS